MPRRFALPEDRLEFWWWVRAPGPCDEPYWYFDEFAGRLVIELVRDGWHGRCEIPLIDLDCMRLGWRDQVALKVRMVRRFLRNQKK